MRILLYELKKTLSFPSIWIFVGFFLLYNAALSSFVISDYANEIAKSSRGMGVVADIENIFHGYTTEYIANTYVQHFNLQGLPYTLMYGKYARLQYAVDNLYASGAGMTLYFSTATAIRHSHLVEVILRTLLIQGVVITSLVVLLSLSYERTVKTEEVVFTTKLGRRINSIKLFASLLSGVIIYFILTGITMVVYLYHNPFGGAWRSSVSSGFNFIFDNVIGIRPFITWHSFSVASYLNAYILVSLALVLCFGVMAYICGLIIRNAYVSFFIIVLINAMLYEFPVRIFRLTLPFYILNMSPANLVFNRNIQSLWFTDGGYFVVLPYFETLGVIGSSLILVVIAVVVKRYFSRRDIL